VSVVGALARPAHGASVGGAVEELFVKGSGEQGRRVVVYGPTGGDDRAAAHGDELHGDARRELRPPFELALGFLVVIGLRQMAAVNEKQVRRDRHLVEQRGA
jgi:hypothetical protein